MIACGECGQESVVHLRSAHAPALDGDGLMEFLICLSCEAQETVK